jgi:hypothetical protein
MSSMRALIRVTALWASMIWGLSGCGRIGPGASVRPPPEYDGPPSAPDGPRSPGYVSPLDEKGCTNPGGDSGQKLYQQCRSK